MVKKHRCLLCMGSNTNRYVQLSAARRALYAQFPDICFGTQMETEAIGSGFSSPFSNQLAMFTTFLSSAEVHAFFKDLERLAGRRPEHKEQGVVHLDVDLLSYDDQRLKPDDFERPYIRRGLIELQNQHLK